MYDKAVLDYAVILQFVPNRYKSKEMCDEIISENSLGLKYCPDKLNI